MSRKKANILIIDDDTYITMTLSMFLEQHFTNIKSINFPEQIPAILEQENFEVVLMDMNFRKGDTTGNQGLYWLNEIKKQSPESSVILITAYGGIEIAVQAMKKGAMDFIVKPWKNDKLLTTVNTALELSRTQSKVQQLKQQSKILEADAGMHHVKMIGQSPAFHQVIENIEKVAATDANVLILGENGTGKELVAREIHRRSQRKNEVFINIDMGSLSETIFESELFGHVKGAFTDAKESRIGRFEAADGGTLFLDEIGNLSSNMQAKLLAVLQNRTIVKLGSNKQIPINIRLISATNTSLQQMVTEGTFRQDLRFRINTVEIYIPPLRDRIEDIPLLCSHFLETYKKKYQKASISLPDYVVKKLMKYTWPGNIRELQHAIERAVIMSNNQALQSSDFSFLESSSSAEESPLDTYNLEQLEKWAVENALKKYKGNITKAAQELGLTRGAMYRRLEKYEL
ncbi:sigma-54-dependent transcriptional regulator [Chondrinema litorale]|uniref:sigma-54-dependent transcriptional regulator n=1 Tax=Chondrinema litorale TaxID=2994555 RepID=UPI002542937D|nr:sigma-54 dependent transcriptional regulator [Chondrinema litorale]UZR95642.1 sigma-54 dependent transcriptional regulator [Chondrinema litorale]